MNRLCNKGLKLKQKIYLQALELLKLIFLFFLPKTQFLVKTNAVKMAKMRN